MVQYVELDKEIANAFSGLYQGNLEDRISDEDLAFGAVKDGEPAGLFLASFYPSFVSLDWIYVDEKFRGQELGTRMLKGGLKFISDLIGVGIVQTACTDDKMKAFLTKCGFLFDDEVKHYSYRTKLSGVRKLPHMNIPEGKAFCLSKLGHRELNGLNLYFGSLDRTDIPIELPIDPDAYLNVPAVFINNDVIRALLLLKKEEGNEISITYAYVFNNDGLALGALIQEAKERCMELFGEDVVINTATLNEKSEKLMDKLFADAEKKPVYRGLLVS